MDFNQLIHRVTIEDRDDEQDAATGEMRDPWKARGERWAEVKTLSGRDAAQLYQAGYAADHMVRMRYEPGIVPKRVRINYRGVLLYVVHPENVEGRGVELRLACKSGEAAR
jgi:SPP1 family predicted phage head-tail adaptor